MPNIYKYPLEWKPAQTVKCKAVKILDIQIQNGQPVMWAIATTDAKEHVVGIIMQNTGTDVLALVEEFTYISTTQIDGFVGHWFYEFFDKEQYEDMEKNE